MRVGVYVPDVGPESGGALTFIRDVLGALAAAPRTHEFHVLYSGRTPPEGSIGLPLVQVPDPASPMDSTLDATANRLGLDVVWFLTPQSQPVTLPFIATVWDLEHRNQPYFPEVSVSGWTWEERELYYRSTLPRAACVVVGTAEGKRQIEHFYTVPASLIAVVPFLTPRFLPEELREDPERLSELGIRSPFLFYPAQFWPHKNHATLLHALKGLNEQGQLVDLVLTGSDKGNLGHVRAMATELGLDDQVRFLGFIDRRTVVALYRKALALVFPSFFGPDNLPPLEAFALGCPVVAAALPGTAEIFGGAAILLDPADEAAWADAVRVLLRDPQRRAELAERGLARSRHSTPIDYIRAITTRLDAFEPVRRCWSRSERYVHPGVQQATSQASNEELMIRLTEIESDRTAKTEVIHTQQEIIQAQRETMHAQLETTRTIEAPLAQADADRTAQLETTRALEARLAQADAARAAQLETIQALEARLAQADAARAAQLETTRTIEARLAQADAARAAQLETIQALEARLAQADAARAAQLETTRTIEARLAQADADRAAQLETIQALEARLAQADAARAAQLDTTRTIEARLARVDADRQVRIQDVQRLEMLVGETAAQVRRLEADFAAATSARQHSEARVRAIESSISWRAVTLLGRIARPFLRSGS